MTNAIAERESRLEWLRMRQSGCGGSDAAPIVFGVDQYGKTIGDVYDEKTALAIVDDEEPSKPILRGRYLEPIAAAEFVRVTGRKIRRQPMRRHRDHPFMIANVDRQQVNDPRGPGVLEIKAPGWKVFSNIKENGMSDGHIVQLQQYLEVWGYSWGTFAVFDSMAWEMVYFDVERNQKWGDLLVEKEGEFWDYVQRRERPPEPDYALPEMPEVKGEVVKIDDEELGDMLRDLAETKKMLKDGEELKKSLTARTKTHLVTHYHRGVFEVGGDWKIHFKPQAGKKSFNQKALAGARPLDPMKTVLRVLECLQALDSDDLMHKVNATAVAEWLLDCDMDLDQFVKTGAPFDVLRQYVAKPKEEGLG